MAWVKGQCGICRKYAGCSGVVLECVGLLSDELLRIETLVCCRCRLQLELIKDDRAMVQRLVAELWRRDQKP